MCRAIRPFPIEGIEGAAPFSRQKCGLVFSVCQEITVLGETLFARVAPFGNGTLIS